MRALRELWRSEPRARLFFVAHAQSSIGTGAGYVALVVLAYDRLRSPWAITLVLLADFLPAMVLGPLFGAAADRWSRRWCAIVSDVARAAAFIALGFVDSIEATIALALLAGAGTGLFIPAVLASLPSLVERDRLPAATSIYGSITDVGRTVGPAVAAGLFALASAEVVTIANGISFGVSAIVLAAIPFGARPDTEEAPKSLLREAREGLVAAARMSGVRVLLVASSASILFVGMMNVGELLLAEGPLDTGASGYSVLVAVLGLGVVVGSLTGARGGAPATLKRRYLAGFLLMGMGLISLGVVSRFELALVGFAAVGLGNGVLLVNERLLFQSTVPDALMGRLFALADTLGSWAFALAFLGAGVLIPLIGTQELFLLAGAGALLVWAVSWAGLRGAWESTTPSDEPVAVGSEGG